MSRLLFPIAFAALLPGLALAQQDDAPAPGVAGGHRKSAFIAAHDADGDGVVMLDEYNDLRQSRFDGADMDHDGNLDEAEYVAEFQGRLDRQYADQGKAPDERYDRSMEQAHVRHAIVDRNRDGLLSWSEQQLVAASTFSGHDTDENGVVDDADPIPVREDDGDDSADGDTGGDQASDGAAQD
ncbi:CREC-EF hand family protein [Pseudooceanicola algae]|uniref:EF hand n=1 Tax=Pseudooceanicola algae TaxID=1537215 RepID=A0A418SJC8_9RHOB|nr:hypothetical protein [Pseudooceanicola algae]QPM91847.1 hypothetical protein PSAL_031090 [Pseudooceanicola algae]